MFNSLTDLAQDVLNNISQLISGRVNAVASDNLGSKLVELKTQGLDIVCPVNSNNMPLSVQLSQNRTYNGKVQTIINVSNTKTGTALTAGTGLLLYTPTTGKTFYCTGLTIANGATALTGVDLRDSQTVTGTPIYATDQGTNGNTRDQLVTPLKFTVGVFLDGVVSTTVMWALQGWEE